jgi:transcriptional regulator with XRE-family HTH domain
MIKSTTFYHYDASPEFSGGTVLMHERLVTSAQLRAGRALLGLSQAEVAGRACLSLNTIKLAEAEGEAHASEAALAAIRVALEDQGVIFLDADGGEGPGIRLRRFGPPDEGLRPDQLTSENDI